jgi:hypothetical protein
MTLPRIGRPLPKAPSARVRSPACRCARRVSSVEVVSHEACRLLTPLEFAQTYTAPPAQLSA